MKHSVIFCMIIQASWLAKAEPETSFNLPDKNGYHSAVSGTEKHKYGYELKENKHFHHTTTEKDGVRLGCFGYELEGKKYSTQYVADSRGYRVVTDQDLITVYPKTGGPRQASFFKDFDEDPSISENIRYFFPAGCKGIDVLIDNSSRLRSVVVPIPDLLPKLPVTLKPSTYVYTKPPNTYIPPKPSNNYIPPGPPNIYAPNQIQEAIVRPPEPDDFDQLEPINPTNIHLPPENPPNVYLPPVTPATSPANTYLPPDTTPSIPTIANNVVPPHVPPQNGCNVETLSCCENESTIGKFIIPIPLKTDEGDGCCARTAKLILPVKGFDEDSVRKLTEAMNEELDAKQLLRAILQNLI